MSHTRNLTVDARQRASLSVRLYRLVFRILRRAALARP
jgi:hypothetical protein